MRDRLGVNQHDCRDRYRIVIIGHRLVADFPPFAETDQNVGAAAVIAFQRRGEVSLVAQPALVAHQFANAVGRRQRFLETT